jgi:hypothetical protein
VDGQSFHKIDAARKTRELPVLSRVVALRATSITEGVLLGWDSAAGGLGG